MPARSEQRVLPKPAADPGAAAFADLVRARVEAGGDARRPLVISLAALRNQSHATADEFNRMRERLADLLTAAAADAGLTFRATEATGQGGADYSLGGTAYLIYADGFDQWEIYPVLKPAAKASRAGQCAWEPDAPIRLLRFPRPGVQQFFLLSR